jgi:hypothetical protein
LLTCRSGDQATELRRSGLPVSRSARTATPRRGLEGGGVVGHPRRRGRRASNGKEASRRPPARSRTTCRLGRVGSFHHRAQRRVASSHGRSRSHGRQAAFPPAPVASPGTSPVPCRSLPCAIRVSGIRPRPNRWSTALLERRPMAAGTQQEAIGARRPHGRAEKEPGGVAASPPLTRSRTALPRYQLAGPAAGKPSPAGAQASTLLMRCMVSQARTNTPTVRNGTAPRGRDQERGGKRG